MQGARAPSLLVSHSSTLVMLLNNFLLANNHFSRECKAMTD